MNQFSEVSLCTVLQSNLTKHGFVQPTPVQAQAIPPALAGRDVVATAQTGTGKTLAFVLPLLESLAAGRSRGELRAVVLAPTRELAMQIQECLAQMAVGTGVRSALVVGGVNENLQLRAIRRGVDVIIATPGRLCDFLRRKLVRLDSVRTLVLDEADRMLDMGFLPAIQEICETMPESRQTLLFSATIEKSVARLVESHVRNPVRVAIGAITQPADQVSLHHYEVDQDRKLGLLSRLLEQDQGSFLIFARTKRGTERLAKSLSHSGFKTAQIHGDRTQNQRNEAMRGFKNGTYRVLVATDVAARGIHVDGVGHVVNYDLPQVPEDFIHRVGRTGRAGAQGTASTFSTRGERGEIRRIERELKIRLTPGEVATDLPREQRPVHAARSKSGFRQNRSFTSGRR